MKKTGIIKNCINCGKEIYVPAWLEKQGGGKNCSTKCQYEQKIGKTAWNKGKKMPFMHRKMKDNFMPIRAFKKGLIPWNKDGQGLQIAWNKGLGISSEELRIRWSKEYKQWRKNVFTRDNFKCIWCSSTENLQADHIKPFALYPDLRLDLNNGRTLCFECHKTTDTFGGQSIYA